MTSVKYSVVIPVYNEEGSVGPLENSIRKTMTKLDEPYELIFVNDGSTDDTLSRLEKLKESNKNMDVITFEKNFGQTASLNAGFKRARGDVIVSMDGDLQNDPIDIPQLLSKLNEGYDVVCGWRKKRQDLLWKKMASKAANFFQRILFNSHLHDLACTLRVYKKKALNSIDLSWNGAHRFIPYLLLKHNNKITEVEVRHHARMYGKSKYRPTKIFKTVKDFLKLIILRKI